MPHSKSGRIWEDQRNFIRTTNRKFGTIIIVEDYMHGDLLEILQRHGFNVDKLVFNYCLIDNLTAFADLFNLTPNLKKVIMKAADLKGATDVQLDNVLPDLTKLKTLMISSCDHRLIKCFRNAKPTKITIWETDGSEHPDLMLDFLSSLEMLTTLTLRCCFWPQNLPTEKASFPFRLTHLAISIPFETTSHDQNNILRFVKSQAESLTELEIGQNIPHSVCKYAIDSMPTLDTLVVIASRVPRNKKFYERLKENCSLRVIKLLDSSCYNNEFFGDFLKKLTNVRSLAVPYNDCGRGRNVLLVAAQNLSKLETLSIGSMQSIDYMRFSGFSRLKALHLRHLDTKIDWNEFTKINSTLTELSICIIFDKSFLTSDDIDKIATNVDLQILRLGYGNGFEDDDRFFEIIREKCRNLKVLDLHNTCFERWCSKNFRTALWNRVGTLRFV